MSRRNRLQRTIITHLTRLAVGHPHWVIGVALSLALLSVGLMIGQVELNTNRADLLDPSSEFQRHWLEYASEFGATDDVLVLVSGRDRESVCRMIDQLGDRLRQHPQLFKNVHDRFDQDRLIGKGLYYLPQEQLLAMERMIMQWTRLLDESAEDSSIWQSAMSPSEDSSQGSDLLRAAIADPTGYEFPWSLDSLEHQLRRRLPRYALMDNGRLGIVSLHLVTSSDEFARGGEPIRVLRRIVDEISESATGVRLGVTGLPVIEYDEMATSQNDMTRASIITLGAVALLFTAGFGNLRYPIYAMVALLIGIMWTCGYLTFALGHLNILSMSFGVVLIGLGVDFSIHYVARFLSLRKTGASIESAISRTAIGVGPAIAAGGISTALAFFATGVTEFVGVAELGIVAGGGILLCVLATLLVLPALLRLSQRSGQTIPAPHTFWTTAAERIWQKPRRTCVWGLCITLVLALGVTRLEYDHNLLNLQAGGLESVAWERRLLSETHGSAWHAVSIAETPSELRRRRAAFLQLDSVARVEDLTELVPDTTADQRSIIRRIHDQLQQISPQPPAVTPLSIDQLPPELVALARHAFREAPLESGHDASKPAWLARINLLRARVLTDLWNQLATIKRMSNPAPPSLADLPASIQARFIGKSGKRMIRVYARGDIWQTDELQRFVGDVTSVDPAITGAPLQAFYASRQMKQSYLHAAGYAAVAVFAVLWWDLRRLNLVTLAALPTLLGIVQLFGLMGLLKIPLNPANVIVLPLVLGIGIDDGIHVIHDLRLTANRRTLKSATINGIVMTSLTSMVGFGSLMLARHEGLRSLGRVVTLGITCCLLSSTLWLPCLLAMLSSDSPKRPARWYRSNRRRASKTVELEAMEAKRPGADLASRLGRGRNTGAGPTTSSARARASQRT